MKWNFSFWKVLNLFDNLVAAAADINSNSNLIDTSPFLSLPP